MLEITILPANGAFRVINFRDEWWAIRGPELLYELKDDRLVRLHEFKPSDWPVGTARDGVWIHRASGEVSLLDFRSGNFVRSAGKYARKDLPIAVVDDYIVEDNYDPSPRKSSLRLTAIATGRSFERPGRFSACDGWIHGAMLVATDSTSDPRRLVCMDLELHERWAVPHEAGLHAVSVCEDTVIWSQQNVVQAHDLATGEVLWRFETGATQRVHQLSMDRAGHCWLSMWKRVEKRHRRTGHVLGVIEHEPIGTHAWCAADARHVFLHLTSIDHQGRAPEACVFDASTLRELDRLTWPAEYRCLNQERGRTADTWTIPHSGGLAFMRFDAANPAVRVLPEPWSCVRRIPRKKEVVYQVDMSDQASADDLLRCAKGIVHNQAYRVSDAARGGFVPSLDIDPEHDGAIELLIGTKLQERDAKRLAYELKDTQWSLRGGKHFPGKPGSKAFRLEFVFGKPKLVDCEALLAHDASARLPLAVLVSTKHVTEGARTLVASIAREHPGLVGSIFGAVEIVMRNRESIAKVLGGKASAVAARQSLEDGCAKLLTIATRRPGEAARCVDAVQHMLRELNPKAAAPITAILKRLEAARADVVLMERLVSSLKEAGAISFGSKIDYDADGFGALIATWSADSPAKLERLKTKGRGEPQDRAFAHVVKARKRIDGYCVVWDGVAGGGRDKRRAFWARAGSNARAQDLLVSMRFRPRGIGNSGFTDPPKIESTIEPPLLRS